MLVNFWPYAKRGPSAHVAGTKGGAKSVTIDEAIRMTCTPPPRGGYGGKRDQRSGNYRKIKIRMLRKSDVCWVCGTKLTVETATLDHVIPLTRGGQDHHTNMKLACEPCNKERGSEMPELKSEDRP